MDYLSLSKIVSHALRHEPEKYGLVLDKNGWVSLKQLVNFLNANFIEWSSLKVSDIEDMIKQSVKIRHEILGGKIRATYGHSTQDKLTKKSAEPPEYLYHGTTLEKLSSIKKQGLKRMQRQYVHLSKDKETALLVAKRWKSAFIILTIKSKEAHRQGIKFYPESNNIWLSDKISSEFIIFN